MNPPESATTFEEPNRFSNWGLIHGLRLLGGLDLLAFIAVVMPLEWMSAINVACGLEPLPGDSRVISYLTRSTSALYALHGSLVLFISFDVARYRPLIRFLAVTSIIHAAVLLGIDLTVGMPLLWTLLEAPSFAACGLIILWLSQPRPT